MSIFLRYLCVIVSSAIIWQGRLEEVEKECASIQSGLVTAPFLLDSVVDSVHNAISLADTGCISETPSPGQTQAGGCSSWTTMGVTKPPNSSS